LEIAWDDYYRANEGRSLRPLFLAAADFLPTAAPGGRDLVAVDLGCGEGIETLELLARGWMVTAVDGAPEAIARLRASVSDEAAARLVTIVSSFGEVELPDADFVYASFSLPFCPPSEFGAVWQRICEALRPGAFFAGHLFGPNDSWAETPGMTFHTRTEVDALFSGFDVLVLNEQDEDGNAVSGPKHWHVFHVVASKGDPD
jgi:SAM-dependent methyltransferase